LIRRYCFIIGVVLGMASFSIAGPLDPAKGNILTSDRILP